MTLDDIRRGERVFIDSTIFIYHFTGVSDECRAFLERCEIGEIKGVSSVVVLAEVAHRLMMIEAVADKLVSCGNVAKKLRGKPQVVKRLQVCRQQVERIPLMGIEVTPFDMRVLLFSMELQENYGLLLNDSLIAATAIVTGVETIATADSDFKRVKELHCLSPTDVDVSS